MLPGRRYLVEIGIMVFDTRTARFLFSDPSQIYWGKAIWLNGEFFMELRHGPFHLRPFVGVARRVGYASCTFDDRDSVVGMSTVRPCAAVDSLTLEKYDNIQTIAYTGVAIGFGLL